MESNTSHNIKLEDSPQSPNSIPLFIRKLWKIVNDAEIESIISWNSTGNGFIIHDQFQFIEKVLPRYYKHNQIASFVRQLNIYNFHKVQSVKKNVMEFAHDYFQKDLPEVLQCIKRKDSIFKQKKEPNFKEHNIQELLKDVKDLKLKHTSVEKELTRLKQENLALWTELNLLRVKYSKQSTIINMLLHFLISYIHSHQTTFSKPNIHVSSDQISDDDIKVGPKLLKIDYKKPKESLHMMQSPSTSKAVTYALKLPNNPGPAVKRSRKTSDGSDGVLSMEDQVSVSSVSRLKNPERSGITYSIKFPGQSEKLNQSELQRSLLDILKENDKLCEEDTEEMLAELYTNRNEMEVPLLVEDNITEGYLESDNYTVSYPVENAQEDTSDDQVAVHSLKFEPLEESHQLETDITNSPEEPQYSDISKFVVKEIPIHTPGGKTSYKITYQKSPKQNSNKQRINVIDHTIIPSKNKSIPKFIKIPVKNINADVAAPQTLKNIVKNYTQEVLQPNILPTAQTGSISNTEDTSRLLEILKENEKLTDDGLTEIPAENLISQNNLDSLIEDFNMDQEFDNYYINETEATNVLNPGLDQSQFYVQSPDFMSNIPSTSRNMATYNILENPKENFSTYVDNTQEKLDVLQNYLMNLKSNDLSGNNDNESNEPST